MGLPNGVKMVSTKESKFTLPQLSETAREVYILAGLTHNSIISM